MKLLAASRSVATVDLAGQLVGVVRNLAANIHASIGLVYEMRLAKRLVVDR